MARYGVVVVVVELFILDLGKHIPQTQIGDGFDLTTCRFGAQCSKHCTNIVPRGKVEYKNKANSINVRQVASLSNT